MTAVSSNNNNNNNNNNRRQTMHDSVPSGRSLASAVSLSLYLCACMHYELYNKECFAVLSSSFRCRHFGFPESVQLFV
jgi:hypothetical protein